MIWKRLIHPNIIPLLGVTISPRLQLVSNWMSGGDLLEYVEEHSDADPVGLVGTPRHQNRSTLTHATSFLTSLKAYATSIRAT